MTKSSSAAKGTKMTIPAAARIYRTTAVKGDGSVPKDSFGARAMRAAMRPATEGAKPGNRKSE